MGYQISNSGEEVLQGLGDFGLDLSDFDLGGTLSTIGDVAKVGADIYTQIANQGKTASTPSTPTNKATGGGTYGSGAAASSSAGTIAGMSLGTLAVVGLGLLLFMRRR